MKWSPKKSFIQAKPVFPISVPAELLSSALGLGLWDKGTVSG